MRCASWLRSSEDRASGERAQPVASARVASAAITAIGMLAMARPATTTALRSPRDEPSAAPAAKRGDRSAASAADHSATVIVPATIPTGPNSSM